MLIKIDPLKNSTIFPSKNWNRMRRSIRLFYPNDCNSRCTSLVFLGIVSGSNCKSNNYLHTQERTQSTEPQELHAKRQFREAIDVHCAGNFECGSCKSSQVSRPHRITRSHITTCKNRISISYLACSNVTHLPLFPPICIFILLLHLFN